MEAQSFLSQAFQNEIIQLFEICGYKERYDNKFFVYPSLLLLFLDPGSEIRDPG
jgi:hypothetical protein